MAGLYRLSDLSETCRYLPMMAKVEGSKKKGDLKVTYLKTYPAYPWKPGTGDHFDQDPITFIDLCAQSGLVKWETEEERKVRLEQEKKKEGDK